MNPHNIDLNNPQAIQAALTEAEDLARFLKRALSLHGTTARSTKPASSHARTREKVQKALAAMRGEFTVGEFSQAAGMSISGARYHINKAQDVVSRLDNEGHLSVRYYTYKPTRTAS